MELGASQVLSGIDVPYNTFHPEVPPSASGSDKKNQLVEWGDARTCDSETETETSTSHLGVSRKSLSGKEDD